MMEAGTSFRQFEFCKLCKLSHKKRKKHVYSKHHQEILRNILKKFAIKISAAKKMLFAPVAREADFEYGAKFWCYFCEEQCEKHKIVEMTTVLVAGLLEHVASTGHRESTAQFFWDNLITDKKLKASFLLSDGDLEIFKKASFLAVKKFQKAKDTDRKRVAATISLSEFQRQNFIQSEATKSQIVATEVRTLPENSRQTEERIVGKKTVSAYAAGLTFVETQVGDENEGNIFTGATPPWLQKDKPTDTRDCIGPTMEDYQKHLEQERKSRLPATRVGAKFDHTAESSQNWLPSFGRVWSKGRRLQSKLHFEKEMKSLSKGQSSGGFHKKKGSSDATYMDRSLDQMKRGSIRYSHSNSGIRNETSLNKESVPDLPHTGEHVQSFENELVSGDNSHNSVSKPYSSIIPYKRKGNIEASDVNKSHWSISETVSANHNSSYSSANQIIQYKRMRTETASSTSLIQTPLLYNDKFKPNE